MTELLFCLEENPFFFKLEEQEDIEQQMVKASLSESPENKYQGTTSDDVRSRKIHPSKLKAERSTWENQHEYVLAALAKPCSSGGRESQAMLSGRSDAAQSCKTHPSNLETHGWNRKQTAAAGKD